MSLEPGAHDRTTVQEVTSEWPDKPTELADQMMDQYGVPDEVTDRRLFWHDVGVWKRVQVYRDGTPHNFPKSHEDHLRQTIDYPIDPDLADELIAFDGSNVLYRTRGELAADCHEETMNILALNLAHDVVTGEKSVDEARQAFAEIAIRTQMGREPEYVRDLQFDVPRGDTGDPDESIVTEAMKTRLEGELEDLVEGEEE